MPHPQPFACPDEAQRNAPPVARRVRARLTRNGVHMMFVAMFAALGGSVRGFNLLIILAGAMVGALIVHWRFSRGTLAGLSVDRFLPREAFAGQPFRVRFAATNHRRWLCAWTVRLEDRIRGHRLPAGGRPVTCGLALVPPQSTVGSFYDCTIARRGRYRIGPVRMATAFPLGLVNVWRDTRAHAPLVVFPSLVRLSPNWIGILRHRREGLATSHQHSGPSEGEFFGIRQWQSGDSQRWIHWRTTARIGQLAVRQFEQTSRNQLSLMLDPYLAPHADDSSLELAISLIASIVVELSACRTNRQIIGIADASARTVTSAGTRDFRRSALTMLATVKPASDPRLSTTLGRLVGDGNFRWPILVISPRAPRMDLLVAPDPPGKNRPSNTGPDMILTRSALSRLDLTWVDVTGDMGRKISPRGAVADATT